MSRTLYAISDVHVSHPENLAIVHGLRGERNDWLVIAGDIGENAEDVEHVLTTVVPRFEQVIWTPGNHELWTGTHDGLRGEAKYHHLVELCREHGVRTPEDPYLMWDDGPRRTAIVPMFLLYDYSFRPPEITREAAVEWAAEQHSVCADEDLLWPDPYPSREAWCAARVASTEQRLAALPDAIETVLVNHFPLRRSHAVLPRIPRFAMWCGTTKTDNWHIRFRARAVIYGHLHIPRTHIDDGVRFEEVSLGYPRQRRYHALPPLRRVLTTADSRDHL
jgi:3',5'-cyclic AMP phosphodiesterase CpdA